MDEDEDVIIQLTTTEEIIVSTMPENMERELFKEGMPVCCVTFDMPTLITKEIAESAFMELATKVYVDTEKRYLRIGDEKSSLVEGSDLKDSKRIDRFFEKWVEHKSLLFAFNCIYNDEYQYGIKGIWAENKWQWLIFETEISIQTGEPTDGDH